ncbi:MAG: molybdopterin molybdotransferase MoeA [Bacteroidetes bacterium]|nr:molybdopterin molybdotransferase MoeA [Bacteroidota bacterium]
MLSFEQATNIVLSQAYNPGTERVPLSSSLNRVLAEDIFSDMEMPPFDKAAVDGYACRLLDIHDPLRVIGLIPAGVVPSMQIGKGECSKIMTGAMVPEGADGVLMVEDIVEMPDHFIRFTKNKSLKNICYRGEDIKKGEKLLSPGTWIQPQHIAVLATAGITNPLIYRQVNIGIISTGDELVEPDTKPAPSKIRNSNAWQLIAQVTKAGAIPQYLGIALDDQHSLYQILDHAIHAYDLVLLTGGVSMGDYDFVPDVLKKAGVEILFQRIAIQPGKPTVFGKMDDHYIFGLPGNPVSSFVLFEILVRPFILKLTGGSFVAPDILLPMGTDYSRKKSTRQSFFPVKIVKGELIPVEYHGSAHINAYTNADGIVSMAIGQSVLKKGELVNVRQV